MAARKASARAADDSANAGRSDIIPASFDVQEHPVGQGYDYLVCRVCKLRWFLPKDATRRTAEALDILADHAASHSALDRS